jgi:flagellar basal-body rod protein FlgC
MSDAMTIAASGMRAAGLALSAVASNVANANTSGPVPNTPPTQPVPQTGNSVYQPVAATQSVLPGGGVTASLQASVPGYTQAYDPQAPYANAQGMIATPNIDMATQMVSQMQAAESFRANLAVYRTASKMDQTLLDTIA